MCGVTAIDFDAHPAFEGLSPRVRGHPPPAHRRLTQWRSIPACAGSPTVSRSTTVAMRVYPRVCGVTSSAQAVNALARGLSPRVRGHHQDLSGWVLKDRSIPACAGSPLLACCRSDWSSVYPRVCGVTSIWAASHVCSSGLSPRVRGHLCLCWTQGGVHRSIPACAGSPRSRRALWAAHEVYPRVCGVTPASCIYRAPYLGLSPRVRGHPPRLFASVARIRSIPACAGSPHLRYGHDRDLEVYPRVCGVTRRSDAHRKTPRGLSPRVRGHR